ncbi:acyloxyacyl hydrolase [Thalassotalea sp. HSM 43]|uniref:acyloxyacyl hydrolase n=1 Tax=Thalassotalea sp. HSM 43 TaxID=2552945 RepID=UPI001081830D|nr:acyloxyacyl hydrolase [Thalassotalea sp. HSM 43]QBY03744.1 acyloxyacyl hydrolase [Thalassotalea sp. HSM 43]
MIFKRILLIVLFIFHSSLALASGLMLSVGTSPPRYASHDDNDAYQITWIEPRIFDISNDFSLTVDLEASVNQWRDNSKRYGSFADQWYDDIYGLSVTPVIKLPLYQFDDRWLLQFGFGIGVSYQNDDNWGYAKLGSRWMFEDKVQLNLLYQQDHQLTLFWQHYSNANLASDNQGADIYGLAYGFYF